MKRAIIRHRRRDNHGRDLVCIVCPVCDGRHWLPVSATGTCPRRGGIFTIAAERKRAAS